MPRGGYWRMLGSQQLSRTEGLGLIRYITVFDTLVQPNFVSLLDRFELVGW